MSGGLIELGDLELLRSNTQGVCKFDLVSTEKIFKKETHIGIAFEENRKKAKEGMIYSISYYRFHNGGFFMLTDDERTVELVSKLDGVFLGMKSRWAAVKVGEVNTTAFEPPDYENVAVALITPAVFDGGGMPKDRTILGKKVLTTAGIRKLVVSGWDLCKNRPKKIYHAVSPGAVYYLEGKVSGHVLNESKFTDFGFGRCVFMKYEKL
jgi:CRISPR-associated protein Cmr3